jgi:hypothetical protein
MYHAIDLIVYCMILEWNDRFVVLLNKSDNGGVFMVVVYSVVSVKWVNATKWTLS